VSSHLLYGIKIRSVSEAAARPAPGTILVIDDDEGVLLTFSRMLRLEGYDVRTAATARKGLEDVSTSPPDAIILDLRMPLVDGLGVLRCLRTRDPERQTPVAIVTGDYFLDEAVSAEIRQLGAHLRFKPLWVEDLVRLAHTLLRVNPEQTVQG